MSSPVFEVRGLRVEREAVILQEINWRVEAGQHWVILGPNGCGKTSLLSAVTGYLMPTRGSIQVGPARYGAADWREVRRSVGLVSASLGHGIEPDQTAREVVLSGADAQINFWRAPGRNEKARADRLLRQVRAAHLADRPWRYLSQGERQRLLIGRALMARLTILFLDEPCAGLDPVAREDFLRFLDTLAKEPAAPTLVLVTHHVEEIAPLFTHLLLLARGAVKAAGPRRAVLTSAQLSAAFGAPVRLARRGGRYQLTVGDHARAFAKKPARKSA
jgi:iron complex transport system ATP-binding protein